MKSILVPLTLCALGLSAACSHNPGNNNTDSLEFLKDSLEIIAAQHPGETGIALLTDEGDTIVVNNEVKYPLMSVFKLHQAIALCHRLEKNVLSLDSVVCIDASSLNSETWSPMLKEHTGEVIALPLRELLRYTLMQSDNNASNYLFDNFCSVAETDSFTATLIPRESFRLTATEAEMRNRHELCYQNVSSPLGAALLIDRLFSDSTVCAAEREFLCTTLSQCSTGLDRIVAPLRDKEGVTVAHKTGSGFRDSDGRLTTQNDVAYITLPDGRHYTLAVLVKDFKGDEHEASGVIAEVSAAVYRALAGS